jgi:ketosteroid isomerase-like protein
MQKQDTLDPQNAEKIKLIAKKYDEAVDNNDASTLAALFTDDAVLVTDGGPIYGRPGIEKWHLDLFQQGQHSNHQAKADEHSPHVLGTGGDEVWLNGEWSETVRTKDSATIHITGFWSAIDTRVGDDWKIRMLTFNLTPVPPAEAI